MAPLLLCLSLLSTISARYVDTPRYVVTSSVEPLPIISFRQQNTNWRQVFNPTYVEPTPATNNRSGLLVRSQNCTQTAACGPTCAGTGQQASWLTWAELSGDQPAAQAPKVVNYVETPVFGPFDCEHGGSCIDSKGTEDPAYVQVWFHQSTQVGKARDSVVWSPLHSLFHGIRKVFEGS